MHIYVVSAWGDGVLLKTSQFIDARNSSGRARIDDTFIDGCVYANDIQYYVVCFTMQYTRL